MAGGRRTRSTISLRPTATMGASITAVSTSVGDTGPVWRNGPALPARFLFRVNQHGARPRFEPSHESLLTICFSYINLAGWQMSSKSLYRWGLFTGWAKDIMLSQKAKYAMKALIALARSDGKLLQSGDISV